MDIHCNNCGYEGPPKTNSGTAFIIFFVMLCSSIIFLPMIVVALVYMAWVIMKPPRKSCPQCKSNDVVPLEIVPEDPPEKDENPKSPD